jgi:hypothetical protein
MLRLCDLSADDWRWLRSRYGDFVIEEPDYAPALIEIRNRQAGPVPQGVMENG